MIKALSNRVGNFLLILAIISYPIQSLSFRFYGGRYDFSIFLFSIGALLIFPGEFYKKNKVILFIFLLTIYELFLLSFFDVAPIRRLISSMIWISFSIYVFKSGYFNQLKLKTITNSILYAGIFSLSISLFQKFFLNQPRVMGFFEEPSYAGLFYYAMAIGFLAKLLFGNFFSKSNIFLFLVFLFFGFLTKSMQIFTFLIMLSIIFLIKNNAKKLMLIIIGFFGLCFFILLLSALSKANFSACNFFDHDKSMNLSLLSWLRGFDQAISSLNKSIFFGLGFGSTGYFTFESLCSQSLDSLGYGNLNLTDSYSMLWRLIIECGIFGTGVILLFFLSKYFSFLENIKLKNEETDYIFILFFSFFLFLGILLKEPSYSSSQFFMLIYLFGILNFYKIKKI